LFISHALGQSAIASQTRRLPDRAVVLPECEDDIKQLLATHEALAACILNQAEAASDSVSQSSAFEQPT
jgi:hypothetical protein